MVGNCTCYKFIMFLCNFDCMVLYYFKLALYDILVLLKLSVICKIVLKIQSQGFAYTPIRDF